VSAPAGRAWVFGDDVDTDALAPGTLMKFGVPEIAKHCLAALEPRFPAEVRPGDVVVGGENFGMGSSREQAPAALRHLGVAAVVARSFAGLFFRNCVNLGLAPLECADAGRIRAGDALAVDPVAGRIENRTTGETLACEPIPPHLAAMLADGGLLPHLKRRLASRRGALAGLAAVVALGAAGCSKSGPQPPPRDAPAAGLPGPVWRVVDVGGRAPPFETRGVEPTLQFDPTASRVSGSAGVNQYSATAVVAEDDTVRVGPPVTTRRLGPQPAMEFETAMLVALRRVTRFRIAGRTLELYDHAGVVLMRLERRDP
jgi:3-isopropylmalate/(R)-2-methylmalate dehydratase small subunit